MPQDLFGDVFVRPRSNRPRRRSLVVLSLVAHGAVLAALLVVPLLATDTLPIPQRAIDFVVGREIMPVVPDPPRLRRSAVDPAGEVTPTVAPAAPTDAPEGISPESGLEALPSSIGSEGPPRIGDVVGIGAADVGGFETAPPPPPAGPVRVHSGIRAPQKIVDVPPIYPAPARAAR